MTYQPLTPLINFYLGGNQLCQFSWNFIPDVGDKINFSNKIYEVEERMFTFDHNDDRYRVVSIKLKEIVVLQEKHIVKSDDDTCDHEYKEDAWGKVCIKCGEGVLNLTTCSKCGAKAVAFNCSTPGCPVNGGAFYG